MENMVLGGNAIVVSSKTNWGKVLRITIQAGVAGTVTVREASGDATIATFAPLGTGQSKGINAASISGGSSYISLVASGASTKQVGIEGTDDAGETIYDSQALNGTTTVTSNLKFKTVTFVDTGDVENTVTVTINSYQFGQNDSYEYLVWISGTDLPEGYGDPQVAPQIVGSDYRYLFDGLGKITGVIDGGDCFFVFKSGSIVRLDGPPFQPTVINYNVGMRPGATPYRQGERIYFWSSKGLSYIDIRSNEVTHVFEESMQRSVLDSGNVALKIGIGVFPDQNVTSITKANASCKSSFASISGDPEYNLIFIAYYNDGHSYGSGSNNCLCYNERLDSFSLLNGPLFSYAAPPLMLSFDNDQVASFPGSVLRVFGYYNTYTAVYMSKFQVGGILLTGDDSAYARLPFLSAEPDGPRSRITRVRPIFNNASYEDIPYQYANSKVEIISMSGTGGSWILDGVYTESNGTVSADGWYDVSGCPFSDKHSIGMHLTANYTLGSAYYLVYITDFTGFEIEYVLEPGRSI
jgi:hypothetical protein